MRVYVDTETSGLDPSKCGIVELAAVSEDGREYSSLVYPGESVMSMQGVQKALEVNGITMDEILMAPKAEVVAEEFRRWLKEIGPCSLWAYNSKFDSAFLKRSPWNIGEIHWGGCVMKSAAGRGPNRKLADVAARMGLSWDGDVHRALPDARMTRMVHERLMGVVRV